MSGADLMLGVRHGLPFSAYLRAPALSNSALKLLAKSPAHYIAGQDPEAEPKASLRRGSLLHTLVLEPDVMIDRYRIKPDGMTFATKAGKEWRDETPNGVEIVTAAEYRTACRQADNLRALPDVAALLGSGCSEVSFFWLDPETGAHCKGRADWVFKAPDGVVLLDLKTTEDATPSGFGRAAARYGYHMQAAWYSRGWTLATGEPVLGFVFGAVESGWPHVAAPYLIDDVSHMKGAEECRRLVQLHADCKASGNWPGYHASIQPLSLPAWAL